MKINRNRLLLLIVLAVLAAGCSSQKTLNVGDTVSLQPNTVPTSSDALSDIIKTIDSGRKSDEIRNDLDKMVSSGKAFHVDRGTKARILSTNGVEYKLVILSGPNKDRECVVIQSYIVNP